MFYELPNKYKYKCMKFFQLYDMISMFSIEPLFVIDKKNDTLTSFLT